MIVSQHILVVEDDPQIRQLNYLILSDAGYSVDLAEDGQAGWEAIRKNNYDLVLTDNAMPRLRGWQLVQKMRAAGMATPVIVCTASVTPADEVEYLGMAVAARLLKPFRLEELLGIVKSVLASHTHPPGFSQMWRAA